MPDPVPISVSDVRREIYRASEFAAGEGQPSTDLLGSLFHRAFQLMMDPRADCGWPNVLDRDSLNDSERLRNEVYAGVVGPHLRANQAKLRNSAQEVLTMWEAVGHLSQQVCQLLANSCERKLLQYDIGKNLWLGAEQFSACLLYTSPSPRD